MPLSPIQTAKTAYAITQTDITVGYAGIPITWPEPFADTDYTISFSINDIGQNFLSLDYAVGDIHFKTPQGFVAVMTLPSFSPLVPEQLQVQNTLLPQTLSFVAPFTALYELTYYVDARADGGNGGGLILEYSWTDPSGTAQNTDFGTILHSAYGFSQATYNAFVLAGTVIQMQSIWASGTYFHYDLSFSVIQVPSPQVSPAVGSLVQIEAIAIHN